MATNFTFGNPGTGKPIGSTLFSMPAASSQAPTGTSSTGGFSLGGTGDNKSTGLNLTTATTQAAQQKTLAFTMPTAASGVAAATTAAPTFSLTSTPSSAPSLFPSTTSTALSLKTNATQPSTQPSTTATSLVTSTNVTAAPTSIGAGTSMNFVQLEETINKWTMELEEQEKIFVNQNTQLIAWDMQLLKNGEKIIELNKSVIEVKLLQQQLDHELDFILAQQRELDECLTLLSKELSTTPVNIDAQREHTYHMAESLDTQLKQMSEDLKEIIEHLNESNRTQDSNDPVIQIGHILNAHMNSLQWVDDHVIQIQNKLDEVTKLHDVHRRENERSF